MTHITFKKKNYSKANQEAGVDQETSFEINDTEDDQPTSVSSSLVI